MMLGRIMEVSSRASKIYLGCQGAGVRDDVASGPVLLRHSSGAGTHS